jgi:hypothetical protein
MRRVGVLGIDFSAVHGSMAAQYVAFVTRCCNLHRIANVIV